MNRNKQKIRLLAFLSIVFLMLLSGLSLATDSKTWKASNEKNQVFIDHKLWQNILDRCLITNHPSGVNRFRYNDIKDADKKSLEQYLSELQKIDPRKYQSTEQKAYWINLYNALTVNLILDNYPVKSIKKIGKKFFSFGPWDDEITTVAGEPLTLNDIEHKILRPLWKDPRIHYAVNCASYGCPNLSTTAFTRTNINELLEKGAKNYINHKRGVNLNQGELTVSSIYHWYKEDFGGNDQQLIAHLKQYANQDLKQALEHFSGSIDHDYDWSLNDAR